MANSKPPKRTATPEIPIINTRAAQAARSTSAPRSLRTSARTRAAGRSPRRSMNKQTQMLLVCGAAGGVLLGLLLLLALMQGTSGSGAGDDKTAAGAQHASTSGSRRRPFWHMGGTPPPQPRTLADLLDSSEQSTGDIDSPASLLHAARRAMAGRNLEAARHHAETALEKARTAEEKEEIERVLRVLGYLDQFWGAVRAEIGNLHAGQELTVGSKRLMIVKATSRGLAFRHEGELYTMRIEELPVAIAVALAERRLGTDGPIAHLCVGALLAVDPKGDRQRAREHWQQAGTTGQLLLPELERL